MNRTFKFAALGIVLSAFVGVLIWYIQSVKHTEEREKVSHIEHLFGSETLKVFEPVLPNTHAELPRDFDFHPEYQHEWWQLVAELTDPYGQTYWLRWRFFRYASDDRIATGWDNPQIYISNVVLNSHLGSLTDQRFSRGGIGQAGGLSRPFRVWIDEWSWRSLSETPFPGKLSISTDDFSVDLLMMNKGQATPIGDRGYHKKHDFLPRASFNVEIPFLSLSGVLMNKLSSQHIAIPVTGKGWMAKEWGSELVGTHYIGEDNFMFRLSEDKVLLVTQYRYETNLPYVSATIISDGGEVTNIASKDIKLEPLSTTFFAPGKRIPLRWHIEIPTQHIDITVSADRKDNRVNFVLPQWQGEATTRGSHLVNGYIQLSGY